MYLPGLSLLRDELEIVIATSSRPTIGLMRTGLCITTFSARIAAACSGVGGPASRSLRKGCITGFLSHTDCSIFSADAPAGLGARCRSPCAIHRPSKPTQNSSEPVLGPDP